MKSKYESARFALTLKKSFQDYTKKYLMRQNKTFDVKENENESKYVKEKNTLDTNLLKDRAKNIMKTNVRKLKVKPEDKKLSKTNIADNVVKIDKVKGKTDFIEVNKKEKSSKALHKDQDYEYKFTDDELSFDNPNGSFPESKRDKESPKYEDDLEV